MSPLAQSIYQTLAFFDAQDMPLTLLEIRENLVSPSSALWAPSPARGEGKSPSPWTGEGRVRVTDIEGALNSEISDAVGHREGFYFLLGREKLVESRKRKYRISLQNLRKAKKYLSFLRFFPYLRAVAVSGSLALLNSTENSDIDLFVITKKNRIWLTRFLLSLYFQLLGQRRYSTKIKGRFCLNHYACEGLVLKEDRNLYTAVEYASLIPVLGHQELKKFWEQNKWIVQYVPPPLARGGVGGEVESSFIQGFFEFIFEFSLIAPLLNFLSGLYQKHRIKMQEYILVSDSELSFHPGSRGQKVLAKYGESSTIGLDRPDF